MPVEKQLPGDTNLSLPTAFKIDKSWVHRLFYESPPRIGITDFISPNDVATGRRDSPAHPPE